MNIKDLITRINWLAAKKKTTGLTEEEKAEQSVLRRKYLDNIRAQVKAQLDCIEVADSAAPDTASAETARQLH